jgi:hypothetical protein
MIYARWRWSLWIKTVSIHVKVMKDWNVRANLATLAGKYMQHLEHDADTDARVLRAVVMTSSRPRGRPATRSAWSYQKTRERMGVNMNGTRNTRSRAIQSFAQSARQQLNEIALVDQLAPSATPLLVQ